jgi:hypothetical protein
VIERRPDGDFRYMDPISLKYTGKPFPFRRPEGRVALVIEIEKADIPSCRLSIHRPSSAGLKSGLSAPFCPDRYMIDL